MLGPIYITSIDQYVSKQHILKKKGYLLRMDIRKSTLFSNFNMIHILYQLFMHACFDHTWGGGR